MRAGRARRARQAGLSGRGAQGGRPTGAGGRTGAGRRARARASGSWEQALGARQGAGRAAGRRWAPGLALGSALGALGPFSIRFDSFFFPESPNEHCSL